MLLTLFPCNRHNHTYNRHKSATIQSCSLLTINNGLGLFWWLSDKESACQCRRPGFDSWVGRSPGEGNGNPLQHSCLGNPMDRGAWWATVHGVAKSQTQLSD